MIPHAGSPERTRSTHRMSVANVRKGKLDRPLKVLLYGAEGVGKSSFAAQAPNPVYLASEDGTSQLEVNRLAEPLSWQDVLAAVDSIEHDNHPFETFVVDTLDWLEPLCWAEACHKAGRRNIEDFPYGRGYIAALDLWRDFLSRVQRACFTRNMHLLLLAHSHIRKVDDPITGPYDRHMLKLHDRAGALWKEAVDAVLFARIEVFTLEKDGRTRAYGNGTRVVHTCPSAAFDAKNRFDLPDTLPLSWEDFYAASRASLPDDPTRTRNDILALLDAVQKHDPLTATAARHWLDQNERTPHQLAQARDRLRAKLMLATELAPTPRR